MKRLIFTFSTLALVACGGSPKESTNSSEVVTAFIDAPKSLEDVNDKNPIVAFKVAAEKLADKVIILDKENIKEVLEEAGEYKHCIITTEDHTIVLIDDLEDCKTSGSWDACMPRCEGYIKKGELEFQDDYANNIIGRPDDQERTVYLFN